MGIGWGSKTENFVRTETKPKSWGQKRRTEAGDRSGGHGDRGRQKRRTRGQRKIEAGHIGTEARVQAFRHAKGEVRYEQECATSARFEQRLSRGIVTGDQTRLPQVQNPIHHCFQPTCFLCFLRQMTSWRCLPHCSAVEGLKVKEQLVSPTRIHP